MWKINTVSKADQSLSFGDFLKKIAYLASCLNEFSKYDRLTLFCKGGFMVIFTPVSFQRWHFGWHALDPT